jgi:hypothetical protein
VSRTAAALVTAILVALAGCGESIVRPSVSFDDARPYPGACRDLGLKEIACDALVEEARSRLGVPHGAIRSVDLLASDRCGTTREILCTRGGAAFMGGVRFTLADGSMPWVSIVCIPGQREAYCPQ